VSNRGITTELTELTEKNIENLEISFFCIGGREERSPRIPGVFLGGLGDFGGEPELMGVGIR